MTNNGILYLVPVPIAPGRASDTLPAFNLQVAKGLKRFIAESEKTAWRNLKSFGCDLPSIRLELLNEHTGNRDLLALLQPLLDGDDVGLMSDAGCPGIADPGASLVRLAHKNGIRVIPLTGPSSIVLSVMASGATGQNFAFNGYLPVDRLQRSKKIRALEQLSVSTGQAQFFIETPYRNEQMLEALLSTLQPDTMLFIGADITAPTEFLHTRRVAAWRQGARPALKKVPAVYGIFV